MVSYGPDESSVLIITSLLVGQLIYGAHTVYCAAILATGVKPLFVVFAVNLAVFLLLLPFAVALERGQWPRTVTPKLALELLLISMGYITAFQTLLMMGMEKTSPAITSAMINTLPGLVFIIACCFGFERLDMRCKYSRAKIAGTLMCLAGVMAMSFLQSRPAASPTKLTLMISGANNRDWITGCAYLFSAIFVVSCAMVLQASTMREFKAPLSMAAVVSLIGSILTPAVQLVVDGRFGVGTTTSSVKAIAAYVALGGLASAVCHAITTWVLKRRGPVMVSVFSPVQTVCSAVLSALTLGQFLSWQSMVGILVMFVGLYVVLWAKSKELKCEGEEDESKLAHSVQEPLLKEVV